MSENLIFKGHKTLLGHRQVTFNNEPLDPRNDLFNHARDGIDWGYIGSGPLQLAFAILVKLSDPQFAARHRTEFTKEIVAALEGRDWTLESDVVLKWIESKGYKSGAKKESGSQKEKKELNVVKAACKELGITQKTLAHILEVPEGTVSSWAVKNEIPRLGKKAIEFYTKNSKNEEIVIRFKDLIALVNRD
jgi:DNA-binding transcriptional regulator YiaG